MSKFFFDLEYDNTVVADSRGMDLPDAEAARTAAERLGLETIRTRLLRGEGVGPEVMSVRDESGICVLRLPCAAFLRRRPSA